MSAPETLHPSLWLASQLARSSLPCVDTGFAALSAHLPGSGEMGLLGPALASLPSVLLQPPHPPQALALAALGLAPSQLIWIRYANGDVLWAAESVRRTAILAKPCARRYAAPGRARRRDPVFHVVPAGLGARQIAARRLPARNSEYLGAAAAPGWLLAKPVAQLMRNQRPFYGTALTMVSAPERIEAGAGAIRRRAISLDYVRAARPARRAATAASVRCRRRLRCAARWCRPANR
ncbi:hypothetical protein AAKU55_004066 [Oxalobacteraceae bacterium GrIS 1.11]